jgi:hypothetical protein
MKRWFPQSSLGRWTGLILLLADVALVVVVGIGLLRALSVPPEQWPVSPALYGQLVILAALLIVAGSLGYRTVGAFTLRYEVDRNGLYITWAGNRAVVPLAQVQRIEMGLPGARLPLGGLVGVGYYHGRGHTPTGLPLHLFASQPLARCLVLHTEEGAYAISPADQDAFTQELEQRRNLGSIKSLDTALQSGRLFFFAFWNDPFVRWALLAAFGLNLLLLGYLSARYPALAETVSMRFTAAGEAAATSPRHQVLFLPLAAFVISLVNTGLGLSLYSQEQDGARLLQAASVLVQVLFGIAVLSILTR